MNITFYDEKPGVFTDSVQQDNIATWRQEATTLSVQELLEEIYDDSLVLEWNEICALEFMKRFEQVHKQKKNNNEKAMQGV